jgi:3-hydroxybutyryl-CoA dehydrogenase
MVHPERLVGFDGLFFGRGVIATLVAGPGLSDSLRIAVEGFFGDLGRNPVWIEDSPGLILPRIIGMIANEAAFAAAEGVADPTTIDRAMKLGADYPVGPLEGAEELGHTRVVEVLEHLYTRFGEERYRTAPLLRRLAEREQRTGPSAAGLPHKTPGERG